MPRPHIFLEVDLVNNAHFLVVHACMCMSQVYIATEVGTIAIAKQVTGDMIGS